MTAITLTTDFGTGSPYVAAMKGVVLSINPAAVLIDITHAVPPQDVHAGAVVLEDTTRLFPAGMIHVAVIDPGVGTERRLIYAEIGPQRYVCPDNGLLSRLARREPPRLVVTLAEREHWRPQVSATFHGRDILAPVAARLSLGLDPKKLGPRQERLVSLAWPEVRRGPGAIEGSVLLVDSFGNLVTDIDEDMLAGVDPASVRVRCRGARVEGLARTYGDHQPGTLVALIGSTGRLEIALVGGSAAERIGGRGGDRVVLHYESSPQLLR